MATVELELQEPRWPNFIRIKMPTGKRDDGITFDGPSIPVGDLDAAQVEWLCESLRAHCAVKKD